MTSASGALRLPRKHFYALDLSRLVAAVAVLFWHYLHFMFRPEAGGVPPDFRTLEPLHGWFAPLYDYGHIAVQYFWIVSGFVFAHVYLADPPAPGRFWMARIARLWPLHLLTLGVVALLEAAYLAEHGRWFVFGPNDAWHFALNLVLAQYWGFEKGMSFNGPAWSLSVEILAYAVFWAALPALRRGRTGLAAMLMAGAAVLALQFQDLRAFACIAYFFAGTTIYLAMLRGWARPGWLAAAGIAGLALAWRFDPVAGFDFPQGGLWVLALFALALLADRLDTRERLGFGKALGDASYGTYLWHFPIQLVLVMVLDSVPGGRALTQQWPFLALYLALAIAAGFASHRWFEKPAQRAILAFAGRRAERPMVTA